MNKVKNGDYSLMDFYLLQNGDELVIRQGRANDFDNIIKYIKTVSVPSEALNRIDDQLSLIKELDNDSDLFLVAEVSRQIIGYLLFIVRRQPKVSHVGETFISVSNAYKEMVIHKLLINSLISWAKTTAVIRKINLKIPLRNKKSIIFYKKVGFKSEGLLRREFYNNGMLMDAVSMGICVEPLHDYHYGMVNDSY
jgi:RimJ/RimL family protein N-acetyltransferase